MMVPPSPPQVLNNDMVCCLDNIQIVLDDEDWPSSTRAKPDIDIVLL